MMRDIWRIFRRLSPIALVLVLSAGLLPGAQTTFHSSIFSSQENGTSYEKFDAVAAQANHLEIVSDNQKLGSEDHFDSDIGRTQVGHCHNMSCVFLAGAIVPYDLGLQSTSNGLIINSVMNAKADAPPLLSPPRNRS